MKTQMAFLMASILLFSSCIIKVTGEKDRKFKVSKNEYSFAQTYKVTQPANLKIATSGGNISTFAYGGDQIEVNFVVTKYGKVLDMTMEELKQIAEVEIINEKSNLEINIRNISQSNISVGFRIKTPVHTTATLNTSGGNVTIAGLTANQSINTSGGNIEIKDITGDVDANTSGGNIDLENSTGKFNATTSGGNIRVNKLKSELRASTSGGNLDLTDVQGAIDVSTSGGSINLDKISGSVNANTSGGDISAFISKLTVKMALETSGGNINCTLPQGLGLDLDLSGEDIDTPLANFSGTAEKDRIRGKMNGGGIPVNLTTFGGSINLNYK